VTRTLTAADFELLRDYLRRTAGLEFDEGRRVGLAGVVHDRLAATGEPGVAAYVAALDRPGAGAERQQLLDAVTIQETHFHRARPQIEALRGHILPDVLTRAARDGREAVVWSAGCATGEEAFTLAMLMLEVAGRLAATTRVEVPPMRVVGTDVSTAALEVARAATYSGRTIDLAEPDAVDRWLRREPHGTYIVKDEVRAMVDVAHHNLVTDPPPFPPHSVDLVVCRHVTIYFSRETTRGLVRRFRGVLAPAGWLVMGPAESLWQVSDDFALVPVGDAFAYRTQPPAATARPRTAPRTTTRSVARAPVREPTTRTTARSAPTRSAPTRSAPTRSAPTRSAPTRSAPTRSAPLSRRAVTAREPSPLEAAQAAFDTGGYSEAAALAEGVLADDAVNGGAYLVLGHARLNQGDAAGAVEPLQRAVFLEPLAGHAHFLLAVALSSAGRPGQAAAAYRAAANTLPGVPAETLRRMLDGRRLQELVQLCHRLADEAEGAVDRVRRGA
jgi:chemotaxis protein methyltransferase CheR